MARKPKQMSKAAPRSTTASAGALGWKLEDAKARFSELVRRARRDGPQRVTVHGKDAVVVVASDQFDALQARSDGRSLRDLLVHSPLRDLEFGAEGVASPVREVEL